MALLGNLLDKLARSPEETREENLQRWARSVEGAIPIQHVEPRRRCRIAGVVQNVRIDPRQGRDCIEATIIDGSGNMIVKWLGRQALCGIGLGMGLIVDGTVGVDPEGELVVLNPEYVLVPEPEHE